jgi:phenylalanyl-tRNA synthetase alpha chain
MLAQLDQMEQTALNSLAVVADEAGLEHWRVAYLGRSSPLMGVFDSIGGLSKEERPTVGRRISWISPYLDVPLHAGVCTPLHKHCARFTESSPIWASKFTSPAR